MAYLTCKMLVLEHVVKCFGAVMEVACGEYGDMVPRLVVAVKSNQCSLFQDHQKQTNCDKGSLHQTDSEQQMCKPVDDTISDDKEVTFYRESDNDEATVNDGSAEQIEMSRIVHNNQHPDSPQVSATQVAINTTSNGDISLPAKVVGLFRIVL